MFLTVEELNTVQIDWIAANLLQEVVWRKVPDWVRNSRQAQHVSENIQYYYHLRLQELVEIEYRQSYI